MSINASDKEIVPENLKLKEIGMNDTVPGGFKLCNINFNEIERILKRLGERVKEFGKTQDINEFFSTVLNLTEKNKKAFVLKKTLQIGTSETVTHNNWDFTINRLDEQTFAVTRNFSSINHEDWDTLPLICQVKNSDGIVVDCQISTRENAVIVQLHSLPEENLMLLIL